MATKARDNHREDVAGRANVEDTPELLAYYDELETAGGRRALDGREQDRALGAEIVLRSGAVALRGLARACVALGRTGVAREGGTPRHLSEQSRPPRHAAAVGWLYSGLQVMHPGEVASAHAHSASALRFIMEGEGAYTIVDGHKMTLGANDFVLTPNGTWHEHGVSSDGTPCIWQDGLDIPLVNALEANFYAVHPELQQSVGHPVDDMRTPGAIPACGRRAPNGRRAIRRC